MELSLTNILFGCHQHSVKPRKVSENTEENGDGDKEQRTTKYGNWGYLHAADRQSPVLNESRNISKNK